MDYLEIFVRLGWSKAKRSKKLELYREEYLSTVSLKDQKLIMIPIVSEINRRKEARKRKEEEKTKGIRKEKEQKIEEARRQEEQRRLEEKKGWPSNVGKRSLEDFRMKKQKKSDKESIEEVAAEYEEAKAYIY